ncbi:TetR/AcrR family transcriptional regulator [Phytoactinopolyspora mesophila]|uniref:TetR family transcriptional regulator n=1 Tax=Phytoactinopolyspora mesophila TaxID=2650750 RepID=A0A7K3M615_9ACTN|nr:TetR/AcrR family transcriptional regulator [Phytoactinopolyspora mesophila]NDL58660.1 TetR family transcriptional regulator [Phytoactinopolyspora mesophila]
MAKVRTPPEAWIAQGLRMLAAGGPDAVRVETLAHALGVTKGGFYGHFADRAALLEEMLDTWERGVTDAMIEHVEGVAANQDARTKLRRLFEAVDAVDDEATLGVAVDLAIREWARRDAVIAERVGRVDNRQMAYLRSLFGEFCDDELEVEARCLMTMSMRVGDHLIRADYSDRRRAEVMDRVSRQLLA